MDASTPRRSPARIMVAASLALAVTGVLALAGLGATANAATVISSAAVARPVAPGFVGMSIELKALEQYAGTDPAALDPVLLRLIEQLAPGQRPVLRLGGDSTDWTWWPVRGMRQPAGIRFTLTPQWMAVAHALAAQLNARLILGVNLEANSAALAQAEGREMVSAIGSRAIDALELGNEPELYGTFGWYRTKSGHEIPGRPATWSLSDFIAQYTNYARLLPGVALAGPSSGAASWLGSLGRFLGAEPRVRLVTVHAYPLKHCTKATVVTIGQLLADSSSRGLALGLTPYIRAATRAGLPIRVDEMNGVSCGGTRGVSDSFASALWMLDALFELARAGAAGVNIHTVPNTINEVLGPVVAGGQWQMRVHPEFYGMMMFAQAAPAGSRLLAVRSPLPAAIKVWATRAPGGQLHVIVIDKRAHGATTLRLRIAGARGAASVERLTAPGLGATGGVTFGGQGFGAATATGQLTGPAQTQLVGPTGGVYVVRVAAASAAMLTVSGR